MKYHKRRFVHMQYDMLDDGWFLLKYMIKTLKLWSKGKERKYQDNMDW